VVTATTYAQTTTTEVLGGVQVNPKCRKPHRQRQRSQTMSRRALLAPCWPPAPIEVTHQNNESPAVAGLSASAGGGTRTPDTRIMIPDVCSDYPLCLRAIRGLEGRHGHRCGHACHPSGGTRGRRSTWSWVGARRAPAPMQQFRVPRTVRSLASERRGASGPRPSQSTAATLIGIPSAAVGWVTEQTLVMTVSLGSATSGWRRCCRTAG
jgi:hypothetical protein